MYIRNMTALYIFNDNNILLMHKLKSRAFKNPLWISIGGHFEDEDNSNPNKCIERELHEELGITIDDLYDFKLRYITLRTAKDELRNQYVYIASLKENVKIPDSTDEGILEWVKPSELFNRKMSVTNTAILKHYLNTGINDNCVYGGLATLLNSNPYIEFTKLSEYDTKY